MYNWWGYYDVFWYPSFRTVYTYVGPYELDQQGTLYSGSQVTVPGVVLDKDELRIEQISGNRVRLSWSTDERPVRQVSFMVADKDQTVTAVQTLNAPPFVALFEVSSRAYFLGVSVTWEDETVSTSLVPYRPPR